MIGSSPNSCAGALGLTYHSQPDVGRLREASDNLAGHKLWFARRLLPIYEPRKLEAARDEMERIINSLVNGSPQGSERDWLQRFLSVDLSDRWPDARRLTNAFREDLSLAEMRRLVKEPPGDTPTLEPNFPHPRGGLVSASFITSSYRLAVVLLCSRHADAPRSDRSRASGRHLW